VYDLMYSKWSDWSPCLRSCQKRRIRECDIPALCRDTVLIQVRRCFAGTKCGKSNNNADTSVSDDYDDTATHQQATQQQTDAEQDYKVDTDYNGRLHQNG
jgi:hypothetical protein